MNEKTGTINCNCNNMHLLKKLDYKGFMASFCGVLLVILKLFFIVPIMDFYIRPNVPLLEVKNFQYEPLPNKLITIALDKEGWIWVNDIRITDPSKLEVILEDEILARKQLEQKVLLLVDESIPFEKVVQVLRVLPKVGIKTVGLVTGGQLNPVIEYMIKKKIP